jgi:aryl-alcohol dehydrogenase-like predicted oxidoreductase
MNYKLLGKSGLKVSELCLGTMGFGEDWKWGADYETSKKIFDTFSNAGGNFIDTANLYTNGTSERCLADFISSQRDHYVLATKYTLSDTRTNTNVNGAGNSRKNMMRSVEESLKRLKTDYIDLFYLHAWDSLTPIDEVMRGLDDLTKQGKVNYIALSDTPAWVVSSAHTMAELMGWSKIVALQIEYSLMQRTPERDLIPMAKHFGITVTPWAPLAGGALTGKYLKGDKGRLPETSQRLNEANTAIVNAVLRVASELDCNPSSVALKWVMQKDFSCIPIVGATKVKQFEENLNCLSIILSDEHINFLNDASKIELGFPHDFILGEGTREVVYGGFDNRIIR